MAMPPVANYDQGDSQLWGQPIEKKIMPFGSSGAYGGGDVASFYDDRDDMVGGTDTQWTPDWSSRGDNAPIFNSLSGLNGPIDDDGPVWTPGTRFSDVLSQSDLAS